MLLRESGFTFNGVHSRSDMGMLYAEKDGHIFIPKIRRNEYEIAGVSGTVLMDGETWGVITFEGTLYPAQERPTQAQAQALLRQVSAWLTAGRCPLIFDYEPNVFYLAELSAQSKWSLKNWFGGEISVKFDAQPYAYNVAEDSVTGTGTGRAVTLNINVHTGHPAPLKLVIENTGSAPITAVSFGDIAFSGMNLETGQTLAIDMEPPIGAVIAGSGGTTENALPYATAFAPVYLSSGANRIYIQLTYGTGTKGVQATASARGRW